MESMQCIKTEKKIMGQEYGNDYSRTFLIHDLRISIMLFKGWIE